MIYFYNISRIVMRKLCYAHDLVRLIGIHVQMQTVRVLPSYSFIIKS